MSRSLPPDVAALIQPMPVNFSPTFEDHENGRYVRWAQTLNVAGIGPVDVELGYSRAGGMTDEKKDVDNLRASAWQTMELARLGRRDLLDYCVVGRHRRA